MKRKMKSMVALLLCTVLVLACATSVPANYIENDTRREPGIHWSSDGSGYYVTEDGQAYELGQIYITIKHGEDGVEEQVFEPDDFPEIKIESIEETGAYGYWWSLTVNLTSMEPEAVWEAIEAVRTNPLVEEACPVYLAFSDNNGTTTVTIGDVDGDGLITARDALIILRHVVGLTTIEETELADRNEDGAVTAEDAIIVLQETVGLTVND